MTFENLYAVNEYDAARGSFGWLQRSARILFGQHILPVRQSITFFEAVLLCLNPSTNLQLFRVLRTVLGVCDVASKTNKRDDR